MYKAGIYQIKNKKSGKCYIGSSVNIIKRWGSHIYALKKGGHGNIYLQHAWNKYGEDAFEFNILLYCDKENLIFYEQRAIDVFKSANGGEYNLSPVAGNQLGMKWSLEARKNITGRKHTPRIIQKLSESHKGYVMPEEQKQKISNAMKGQKKPSGFNIGRKHSKQTRNKISNTEKGKKVSEETKRKISKIIKRQRIEEKEKKEIKMKRTFFPEARTLTR